MASGTVIDNPHGPAQIKSLPSSSKAKTTRTEQYTVRFAKQVAKRSVLFQQLFSLSDTGCSFYVCRHEWDSH